MRSDAVIAGSVGGTIGLLATVGLAWVTWAVYRDGEFDVPFFMVVYTSATFVTAVLQLAGALRSRLGGSPPDARFFIASGSVALLASLAGSAFAFVGISSSGSVQFFLIFVLFPTVLLTSAALTATWFASRGTA